jgi:hypothetical protein
MRDRRTDRQTDFPLYVYFIHAVQSSELSGTRNATRPTGSNLSAGMTRPAGASPTRPDRDVTLIVFMVQHSVRTNSITLLL